MAMAVYWAGAHGLDGNKAIAVLHGSLCPVAERSHGLLHILIEKAKTGILVLKLVAVLFM